MIVSPMEMRGVRVAGCYRKGDAEAELIGTGRRGDRKTRFLLGRFGNAVVGWTGLDRRTNSVAGGRALIPARRGSIKNADARVGQSASKVDFDLQGAAI
jgi:hypothetical protein